MSSNVQQLIGYFSLDPSRTLDILLSAFQNNTTNLAYFPLLKEFGSPSLITQLLGFKLQKTQPEQSLFTLIALLLKHELIELSGIWPHLTSDSLTDLLDRQSKSLEYQYGMLFKTIMNKEVFEQEFKAKALEQDRVDQARLKCSSDAQVRLMQACVEVNYWAGLDDIVNGVFEGRFDLSMCSDVLKKCFNAIHWMVEPLFRPLSKQALACRFNTLKRPTFTYYPSGCIT